MPEGDTVWLAARRLHDALAGQELTGSDFRVPRLATVDLTGRTVDSVRSRGKHLLTRIGDDLTLHTHLRMDGSWHLYRPGERRRGGPEWQVRVLLSTASWRAVGYRLPVVDLLARDAEGTVTGHLGPDLLGPDWDAREALRRLSAEPAREVGQALLDQRNLAGIGNLYKAEVCFRAGVSPWAPVEAVADLAAMVADAQRLLSANRETYHQVTTGDRRHGRQHFVFERSGRPCLRCGTTVVVAEQGDPPFARLAYWCPRCQPGPAPAAVRLRPPPRGKRRYRP